MSKYLERAKELRQDPKIHYNCAQSVLLPFADVVGVDADTLFKMAANFGGGMRVASTCGAVTGALMALGLAGCDDPAMVQEIFRRVRENHENTYICKDLLRMNAEKGLPKKPHCDAMVYELVGITEEVLRGCGKIEGLF